ncbi:MAG: rod shape-determining protein RodA [Bacteroidota bacterium]|jgi:rod shape determining protein RodA
MANETTVRESQIDWITIGLYLLIVLLGWLNLYSTSQNDDPSLINFRSYHGKEAIFLMASFAFGVFVLFMDTKFLEFVSYIFYGVAILALIAVFFVSKVNGASSWFEIGGVKIQPTEFAKVATLMTLAKFMSRYNFSLKNRSDLLTAIGIILLPMLLVLAQNDAGSSLVFCALVLVFYREGLHPLILLGIILLTSVGFISLVFSTQKLLPVFLFIPLVLLAALSYWYIFRKRFLFLHIAVLAFLVVIPFTVTMVVKDYQSARFRVLVASENEIKHDAALKKVSYNYLQSLVAVGSGGVWGKGFGKGTHTRGDFVPEEHTDYIHCVFGEEHGFVGSTFLIFLFFLLVARVIYVAENSKSVYARVYGYGVASILLIHVIVNIGMSIGVVPTIGIPLPFFSYGGSSVIAFSLMLFVLMNHYSYRTNILSSGSGFSGGSSRGGFTPPTRRPSTSVDDL